MQKSEEYRKHADECERLARDGKPEHRDALRRIAKAWRVCAEELDRQKEDQKQKG